MHAKPKRTELQVSLTAVDNAWARFECQYITELISVENDARQLIVDAITHEQRLHHLENHPDEIKSVHYYQEVGHLVKHIAKLNAVANARRKGRDDLSAEILFGAQKALNRRWGDQEFSNTEAACAARILATDVVESFQAMRDYLRTVSKCLERVDPHLCNNAGLVARLVDWEESWEIGAKYVQHEPLLHAVCDVVDVVRAAQRVAPALIGMCNDCDVELFMVLPRIIWLQFLAAPTRLMELLKTLLPHRFKQGDHSTCPWDANLAAFIEKFHSVEDVIGGSVDNFLDRPWRSVHPLAWETLIKRVVCGENGEEAYGHLSPKTRLDTQRAVEDLMRELEGYSMELQRHCPEDWNQCSAILVQCLSGGSEEQRQEQFRV